MSNQIVLITGSNGGIGRAIAAELGQKHYWIAGTSSTQEGSDDFSQWCHEQQIQGQGFVLDMRQKEDIPRCIEAVHQAVGYPDILINNAGIVKDQLLLRMSDSDWESVLRVNLFSAFEMIRGCLKPMLQNQFGRIVNIASIIGFTGQAGQANYAASKGGLVAMTKSIAQEVASRNITINMIAPGFIETKMTARLSDKIKDSIMERIPMKRFGKPKDIAHACAFLVSKEASYMTGATLHINGGLAMY